MMRLDVKEGQKKGETRRKERACEGDDGEVAV